MISAYIAGLFPWFNDDDPILWHSPDPRFIILPESLHIPSRLKRELKSRRFELRTDSAFDRVIRLCASVGRSGQNGTWITDDMVAAYCALHRAGIAHSIEAWQDGELVGGFYGELIGSVFFGESMFTRVPEASKVAFASFARFFFNEMGGKMIDSQVYTDHLARFGAKKVTRTAYLRLLSSMIQPEMPVVRGLWPLRLLDQSGGVNL